MTGTAKAERRRNALLIFISLAALYASSYFQRTAVPGTIFNALQTAYGFTAEQISFLGSCMVTVYAFLQLVAGALADRYGGIRLVVFGGAVFAAGVLLFPLCAGNLFLMNAARVLVGAGSSVMYLSLLRESDATFGRKNYAVVLGVIYFIGYGGGLLGTWPFAALCRYFSWRKLLLAVGIVSAVLYAVFVLCARRAAPRRIRPGGSAPAPLAGVLKNPLTWIACYCTSVNFACYFLLQSVFGMKFLEDVAGMAPSPASAVIFSLTLVCMFTLLGGGFFCRMLGNRRKPMVVISTSVALSCIVLMLLAVLLKLPPAVFAAAYFLSAFASGSSGMFVIVAQEVNAARAQTQAAAFMNMCCYLAVAAAGVFIGRLLDSFVDPALFAAGRKIVYPDRAYVTLFSVLLIPTGISFLLSLFVPETKGRFLK
ncbi:MAG: MFS transporter [Lentisphaeria bacterium]|nr:MFS transporter [Lentisphaeria bacterium]